MKAAVLRQAGLPVPYTQSRPMETMDLDLEEPQAHEVLVRIESAGLCHSDLSVVNGSRKRRLPLVLGHEAAGIVEGVGRGVSDIEVGQRVIMTFLPRCEHCNACQTNGRIPCAEGSKANAAGTLLRDRVTLSAGSEPIFHQTGVSAFAEYAVVARESMVPVDADVPPDVAALLGCAVLTGGGAVLNVARPEAGDSLMVVGLGGVGMAAILVGASIDGVEIIGVDIDPNKLEIARELGAGQVYTPNEVAEQGIRATHCVEAAGSARALEAAFEATEAGGRTVTVGLPSEEARISISPLTITAETRSIVGSYLGSTVPSRDIPRYVELWRAGRLPVEKLVSGHITLSDLNQSLDDLTQGTVLRQMVRF